MIIKFNFQNPRRNLPKSSASKRGEANFVGAFERAFIKENNHGVGSRQFAVSGFGIADFVWLNFSNQNLMAFEMKLNDWKRALHQAYRYSYFADRVVVVLPMNKITTACANLELFKDLNIGLWGLDSKLKYITRFFTPDDSSAKSENAHNKAINLISQKIRIDLRMFAEQAHGLF